MNNLANVCMKIFKTNNFKGYVKASCKFHLSNKYFSQKGLVGRHKRGFQLDENDKKFQPYSLGLLIVPFGCFCLGCWQVKRKKWKEDLIADLNNRRNRDPVPLPKNFEELEGMEYYPVSVKGKFLYDKELFMGPRSLLLKEGKGNHSYGLASQSKSGYLVITPFELSDTGKVILINRGWISIDQYKSKSYTKTNIDTEIELTGVVRLHEKKAKFGLKNNPETNVWFYRDVHRIAALANSEPVFLDAVGSTSLPGGPIGNQTRLSLPNDHLSYIITWFGISLASSLMWYYKFMKPVLA